MSDVFPNWNIKARMDLARKLYGVDFVTLRGGWGNLIWEISYKQLKVLACYIAFTYAIIYYLLPLYLSNRKKWFITTGKLVLIFVVFLGLHYYVTYSNIIAARFDHNAHIYSNVRTRPGKARVINIVKNSVLFNLTTLVGLSVAIKLLKRWWKKQKETEMVAREKISAELQMLKAQIHPHFLFNSLNNIYSFALEGSTKAPEMIQKLSGLLHYMLYGCKKPLVPLEKELNMIEDYISLEKIRYGERLSIQIHIQQDEPNQVIAPLILIPFVENSFKHGISRMLSRPEVTLSIIEKESVLYFKLTNTKPGGNMEISLNSNSGLGLRNVRKRLSLLYPGRHELQIIDDASSYTVWLTIQLSGSTSSGINPTVKIQDNAYELA